jgi:hypothetical protein
MGFVCFGWCCRVRDQADVRKLCVLSTTLWLSSRNWRRADRHVLSFNTYTLKKTQIMRGGPSVSSKESALVSERGAFRDDLGSVDERARVVHPDHRFGRSTRASHTLSMHPTSSPNRVCRRVSINVYVHNERAPRRVARTTPTIAAPESRRALPQTNT